VLARSKRPVVVIRDIFDGFLADCAWSPDGYTLACAGSDGQIILVRFTREEIGFPMSTDERRKHFENLYGRDVKQMFEGRTLVETPIALNLQQNRVHGSPLNGAHGHAEPAPVLTADTEARSKSDHPQIHQVPSTQREGAAGGADTYIVQEQRVSRTSAGKKRIRPVLVNEDGGVALGSVPTQATSVTQPVATGMGKRIRTNDEEDDEQRLEFACRTSFMREGVLIKLRVRRTQFTYQFEATDGIGVIVVHADVSTGAPGAASLHWTTLRAVHQTRELWTSQVTGTCLCLRANNAVVCVGCEDGAVHVLCAESGARLLPPIVIGAPAAFVESRRCVIGRFHSLCIRAHYVLFCAVLFCVDDPPPLVQMQGPHVRTRLVCYGRAVRMGRG
jgi:hypothetical protein